MSRAVLILGAAGFIGRHLVSRFAGAGHPVIAAVRRPATFDDPSVRVAVAAFDQHAHFLPLLAESPLVIHAASSTTPGASAAQPQIEGNLRTTLALIEALQDTPDARLIYFSSGGTLYGARDTPAVETDPILPRSYHGAGKAAAEHFIHAWAEQYGGSAVILRPSNVYGPGQLPKTGFGVIPTAFSAILESRPFTIWGDGRTERDFIHIADIVDLVDAVGRAVVGTGVCAYNAASGNAINLNALLAMIEATTGRSLQRHWQPARGVDVPKISLEITRAKASFGWQPRVTLEEGLADTWQWISRASTSIRGGEA